MSEIMMRPCGSSWSYCDGDCEICRKVGYTNLNSTVTTKTNADHIRSMTDEELCSVAQILVRNDVCLNPSHGSCKGCAFDAFCSAVHFEEDVLDWLKQPYREDT